MRRELFFLPLAAATLIVSFSFFRTYPDTEIDYDRSNEIIGCGSSTVEEIYFDSERKMVPLPGWGQHTWKIETTNDSAQFYFNQGLNMLYSFHMHEAKASFMEAQRHDPECAMAYWGQTMAEGSYINAPGYDFNNNNLISLLQKAESLANNETERSIIDAQQLRFTNNKNTKQADLMLAYKNAIQQLHDAHPNNIELAVLYADALMLINPRNWYDEAGIEKDGTNEIVTLLSDILEKNPNHPAALHYYIHMVEPSTTPDRAKDEADRLLPLLPSVAHMVHMPSHIYIRTGDFNKGVASNVAAVKGFSTYKNTMNGWDGNRYMNIYHNIDMQGANASLMGNYEQAKNAFELNLLMFDPRDKELYSNPVMMNAIQFVMAQSYLNEVRFGNWGKVLSQKSLPSNKPYHQLLWKFGQGMALATTGKTQEAKEQLAAMNELLKDQSLHNRRPNRNPAIEPAKIAVLVLSATINAEQKNWTAAINQFESAVNQEDDLKYSEPEDWRLPARQFLGQVYLSRGQPAKAQKVFEEDLLDHPHNYWSVNGLYTSLNDQKETAKAEKLKATYKHVFQQASTSRPLKGATY